jgi:hypothetical protein
LRLATGTRRSRPGSESNGDAVPKIWLRGHNSEGLTRPRRIAADGAFTVWLISYPDPETRDQQMALSLHTSRHQPDTRASQRESNVLAPSLGAAAEALPHSPPGRHPCVAVYSRLAGLDHPYFRLMHRALERCGFSIAGNVEIGVAWLRANRGRVDAVHFHWPETIWRDRRREPRRRVSRAVHAGREILRLARFLREAQRLGIMRIWTIHNLEPHEGASSWDRLGYRLLARSSDVIVGHSARALADAAREYHVPAGRSIVMPMGEMREAYPPARPRDAVLREARTRSRLAVDFLYGPHPRVQGTRPRLCGGATSERPRTAGGCRSRADRL